MFLEYYQCSVTDDDADRDPDHDDGTDAGDAQVRVDVDADAGDEVDNHDSDDMRVERRASRRAQVARLYRESADVNERILGMHGRI